MGKAIIKNAAGIAKPSYEKIADTIVTGATASTIDLTGLNITKDDIILMEADVDGAANGGVGIYFNANYTATNYYTQRFEVTGTSVTAGERTNASIVLYAQNRSKATTYIKLTENGYITWMSNVARSYNNSGATMINDHYGTTTFTATSITSIRLSLTSGLGVGTRVQLFKLKADKIFDTTVSGSAATNIDITGLNIDYSGEYLLLSELVDTVAGTKGFRLYLNGTYTDTSYYSQNIDCVGTTNSAGRENYAYYLLSLGSSRTQALTRIKLSNDGYGIIQSHNVCQFGTSSIRLREYFLQPTFTTSAITSIRVTNGAAQIGVGSRFILYKLK